MALKKLRRAPSSSHVKLAGSKRIIHPQGLPTGPIDPEEIASLTVRLRSCAGPAQLGKRVQEIYALPLRKRKYMSREELAEQYGAVGEELDAVERFAHARNLTVGVRNAARRTLVLKGRLGDLLDAFPADVQMFRHSGMACRGRQGHIRIPKELNKIITGIFGYDTRPRHRRTVGTVPLNGPGDFRGQPATYFADRYRFPKQHRGVELDGSGQCIGIIELAGGVNRKDLDIYFRSIGMDTPHGTVVQVEHDGSRPARDDFGDGEVMLDIAVAGTVTPKAKLAVYIPSANAGNGFFDAVNAAVHDAERNPGVISISWGGPEEYVEPQERMAFHELFLEAAALGITICVASGDHGTANLAFTDWDGRIHVDHPAVDDYVLACGGTYIESRDCEVVWNDGTPFSFAPGGGGWASGGGVSQTVKLPDFQRKAHVPRSLSTKKPGRGVPDIALSATNYYTRIRGKDGAFGGTSAAAPLMAGLVARLNQAKGKNVGWLNPFLYENAHKGITRDITIGTNAIVNTLKGYRAKHGWNACCGLGTPLGTRILKAL